MASIYRLGEVSLPPREEIDYEVAKILEVCCLVPAAKTEAATIDATKSKPPTTVMSKLQFGNSVVRYIPFPLSVMHCFFFFHYCLVVSGD